MTPRNPQSAATTRRRTAAETREHILVVASDAFVRRGYDGVGLREIAKTAGVDPRLVGHYFGSKEGLFAEAQERTKDSPLSVTPESAASLLTQPQTPERLAGMLMAIRSTSNPQAVAVARQMIERNFEQGLAEQLPGEHGRERAALLIAINVGVLLMREVFGSTSLNGEHAKHAVPYLEAVFDAVNNPIVEPS
jgi:AcrR family transcriptional regulator